MDFSNITTKPCLIDCQDPATNMPLDPACCDVEKNCVELTVTPTPGFVEIGGTWPFTATVLYSDGTTEDVTAQAYWTSYSTSIATIAQTGIATAVAIGNATVSAQHCGLQAYGELEVANLCVDAPADYVLVLDRSASMAATDAEGRTRIQRTIEAAKTFVDNCDEEDSVGIVTFSGIQFFTNPALNEGDATLDLQMTDDKEAVKDVIDAYEIRECGAAANPDMTKCATGIGSALEAAHLEISGSRHVAGHKRIIVLMTDGVNTHAAPNPEIVAQAIKDDGVSLIIIGLDTPLYDATLATMASSGLFFPSPTIYELAQIISKIPNLLCLGNYGYPYETGVPGVVGPPPGGLNPDTGWQPPEPGGTFVLITHKSVSCPSTIIANTFNELQGLDQDGNSLYAQVALGFTPDASVPVGVTVPLVLIWISGTFLTASSENMAGIAHVFDINVGSFDGETCSEPFLSEFHPDYAYIRDIVNANAGQHAGTAYDPFLLPHDAG